MGKVKKIYLLIESTTNCIYIYVYIIIIDWDVYFYNMCVTVRRRLDEDNINIYFYYCVPPIYMCSSRRTHYEHLLTAFISSAGLRLENRSVVVVSLRRRAERTRPKRYNRPPTRGVPQTRRQTHYYNMYITYNIYI